MHIIEAADYEDMSLKAWEVLQHKLPRIQVLGLATGGTPVGMYDHLIKAVQNKQADVSHLHTVNLDEYIGLSTCDPNSYYMFMKEKLFGPLGLPEDKVHLPHGDAENPQAEGKRYEDLIQSLGGVDLQVLGIGKNGHIGFNEPGSEMDGRTSVVQLASSTVEANARFFENEEEVPKTAITMGIGTILEAGEILLLASGKNKAHAVKCMIEGEVTSYCPASALQKHPKVTVVADREALSEMN
ncbi:MAG: glucosamine-6-phosphate deaminase [Alkalicoccus sp.]|nr:MAG: glucosamine-6-phosphate deaminase [Alkalicoccus sp.]